MSALLSPSAYGKPNGASDGNDYPTLLMPDTLVEMDRVQITAIKQGLSLKREAVSASVLTSNTIEAGGVNALKDAARFAPNFFAPDYGSRMTSSIYVRGLGTRIEQPVVGLNIDNVPVADKNMYDIDLADIERVEIMRGAQSTLYGRNTMCGVINIYTASPMTYQGTRLRAEYGSRNAYRVSASTYHRIKEKFGVSVSGQFAHCDGYFRNLYDDSLCDKENSGSARAKFQYRNGALSIDNTLSFSAVRQGGYPYASTATGRIDYNDEASYRRAGVSEGLTVKYDMPKVTLSSITSYQYLDDKMIMDQDFLPASYFTLSQHKRQHDITQELVVRSAKSDRYTWTAGVFGFYKSQYMNAPVTFKRDGIRQLILDNINANSPYDGEYRWGDADGNDGDSLLLGDLFTTRNGGAAIYHESALQAGRWRFSLGLRIDYEAAQMRYRNNVDTKYTAFPNNGAAPTTAHVYIDDTGVLTKTFVEWLPKLTISVDLDGNKRNMLYLSAAKGYKAGGFNTQMFSEVLQQRLKQEMGVWITPGNLDDVVAYKPERSWNFETGGHFATDDTLFEADVALFYIICLDQQLTVFPEGQTTGRMMTNAGRTRSVGAEASFRYRPHRSLELMLAYGYTNAAFTRFRSGLNDYRGKRVPYAPEHTLSAQATYTVALTTDWRMIVGLDYSGAGRIWWNEANDASQPFYSLLDGSITFKSGRYGVALRVRNILGTKYDIFYFESMGNRFVQRGRPTSFGIKASIDI
ncbi:MAG: TonB-dependent receptor [Alistipes sp.]